MDGDAVDIKKVNAAGVDFLGELDCITPREINTRDVGERLGVCRCTGVSLVGVYIDVTGYCVLCYFRCIVCGNSVREEEFLLCVLFFPLLSRVILV